MRVCVAIRTWMAIGKYYGYYVLLLVLVLFVIITEVG